MKTHIMKSRMSLKAKKIISFLLVISIILPVIVFPIPQKAEAVGPVIDVFNGIFNKITSVFSGSNAASTAVIASKSIYDKLEFIGQQILKLIAKRLLAEMTKSTINWINSGFHGSPLFLENPESFFNDIAKTQVKTLVDMIGYDPDRFPFGKQTALNIIDSYKSQFEINAQYSLSKVINDPDLLRQYRNDFNYGGWNGFLINTQYPQNNYLGFDMLVRQNLASQLEGIFQAPAQKVKDTLDQGMGFLSPQVCPKERNPNYDNTKNAWQRPSFRSTVEFVSPPKEPVSTFLERDRAARATYQDAKNKERADWEKTNVCPGGLVSTTPGSVVASQIAEATKTPFLTTALDGALGNSIAAIFDALLNKLIGDGLTSLKSTVNPASASDNWSYEGSTLGGGYSGGSSYNNIWSGDSVINTNSEPLTINPQNVSVDIRNSATSTTIATISGGIEPYSMLLGPNEGIAIAIIASTGLIVTGVAPGQTWVVVKDSSETAKTLTVPINVIGVEDLNIPEKVSISIYTVQRTDYTGTVISITGGTPPYSIISSGDDTVATARIEEAPCSYCANYTKYDLIILGIELGETAIVIKDSSTHEKIASINITIDAGGICEDPVTHEKDERNTITLEDCTAKGGTWLEDGE